MSPKAFELKSLSNTADVYNGIVSNLTPQQADAFHAFRDQLKKEGLRDAPNGTTSQDLCNGITDDVTLLRFLRARSYIVENAVKQFRESYASRNTLNLAKLYDEQDVEDYEEARKIYPHWTGRRDKRGLPIMICDVANFNSKSLAAYSKSCSSKATSWPTSGNVTVEQLRSHAFHDDLIRFVIPLCSAVKDRPDPEKPITSTVHIADISSLGLRQFWNMKGWLLSFAGVVSNSMPETLDTVLVIGAPAYFPTIWAWIKKFIDPGTVAKLNIVRANEVQSTLSSYIDIENIPKRYGGHLEFEHGMPIDLDPALAKSLTWSSASEKLVEGPMKWVDGQDGTRHLIAVGSQGGKKRYEKLASLVSTDQQDSGSKSPRADNVNGTSANCKSTVQRGKSVNLLDQGRTNKLVSVPSSNTSSSDSRVTNGYARELSKSNSPSTSSTAPKSPSSPHNEPVISMPDWPISSEPQRRYQATSGSHTTTHPSDPQKHSVLSVLTSLPNHSDENNAQSYSPSRRGSLAKSHASRVASSTSQRSSPSPLTNSTLERNTTPNKQQEGAEMSDGADERAAGDADHFVDAQDWQDEPQHTTLRSRYAHYTKDLRFPWTPYPIATRKRAKSPLQPVNDQTTLRAFSQRIPTKR